MSRGDREAVPHEVSEGVLLLVAFLLSSGRGLLNEPAEYGVARCADGARRALEMLEEACGVREPRLVAIRRRLEETMSGPMDEADFVALLDQACEQVADVLREDAVRGA